MADEDGEKPADQAPNIEKSEPPSEASDSPKASESDASGETSSTPAGDASDAPRKKKKKKKKKRAVEEEAKDEGPTGPVLGPEGWERPQFVLDFPKDPELDRLVRAFELGNYAFVRDKGKKLAESASDEGVRRAASELLRRIEPDPLVKILFAMSIGLFIFMVFYAYRSHGH
jgi:hypothetical protein